MAITITTCMGGQYQLQPFAMDHLPSSCPTDFINFFSGHVELGKLSLEEIERVQIYMRKHKTEALTNGGNQYYTIAGNGLAYCNPFYREG